MKKAVQNPSIEKEITVLGIYFSIKDIDTKHSEWSYIYHSEYLGVDLIYHDLDDMWTVMIDEKSNCLLDRRFVFPEEALFNAKEHMKRLIIDKINHHKHMLSYLEKDLSKLDKVEENYKNMMIIKDIIE